MKTVTTADVIDEFGARPADIRYSLRDMVYFANAMIAESHRWIPVSERLPDKGESGIRPAQRVLVFTSGGDIRIGYILTDNWTVMGGSLNGSKVIFWQPLPPLPGKEGGEQ